MGGSSLKVRQRLPPFTLAVDTLSTVSLCVVIHTDSPSGQGKAPGTPFPGAFLFDAAVSSGRTNVLSTPGGITSQGET